MTKMSIATATSASSDDRLAPNSRKGGINMTDKERNMEKLTTEQAKKLLNAIFAEEDTDEDNYPETVSDKGGVRGVCPDTQS